MLFNSIEFILFLPLIFSAYWILNRWIDKRTGLKAQNLLILAASYLFYGWWDWRFLSLIAFSTLVDYVVGLQIAKQPAERPKARRRWLAVSVIINLGLLGYFKYANFFIESWVDAWSAAGVTMHASTLQIILPVGISFYTFQTLSYSIDIYRRTMPPTRDPIAFAAFVSFFPQLVAGPIERASHLLPQIERRRTFDAAEATTGLRLILWGLFKKVVVADTCALYVDDIFAQYTSHSAPTLILGTVFFAFQIYGDFSGYSDIAIGTARLFGIRLMTNFKTPFFSQNMAEFRRRWHVSLYTWFIDYVYIPLGGSRVPTPRRLVNVVLIFLISGLWHGADWSFVVWALLNAAIVLPLVIWPPGKTQTKSGPTATFNMLLTFILFCIPLVFFRAHSVADGWAYLGRIARAWSEPHFTGIQGAGTAWIWIGLLLLGDWFFLHSSSKNWWLAPQRRLLRWSGYSMGLWWVFMKFDNPADFIYFQF